MSEHGPPTLRQMRAHVTAALDEHPEMKEELDHVVASLDRLLARHRAAVRDELHTLDEPADVRPPPIARPRL